MGSVGRVDQMNVPYDQWGPEVDEQIRDIINGQETVTGYIQDSTVYTSVPELTPIEKKDAINFALEFYSKEDGGWFVDDDYHVYLAYQDGTFRDVADNPEKGLNRKGLIGVYVSTPDDEVSWGGEINQRTGQFVPWSVHHTTDEGELTEVEGNYHSWYRTTGSYKVRTRTTYVPNGKGGWKPKREKIRQSTWKKL